MEEALIRVKDLCKIYNPGENEVRALDHINLEINKGEFVATTGGPRRVGWFDAVATRYGCRMQGATNVALTVLDP